MIVRISGTGQYELDGSGIRRLDELDTELTNVLESGDEQRFREVLSATISFVQSSGTAVADDRLVPSEVIIPPADVTLDEAKTFFTDEGLMAPLEA